jgi:hypothetical protein
MGESMFGESFALDDGPSFDLESLQQQRRTASNGTTGQLSPVIDEEES